MNGYEECNCISTEIVDDSVIGDTHFEKLQIRLLFDRGESAIYIAHWVGMMRRLRYFSTLKVDMLCW